MLSLFSDTSNLKTKDIICALVETERELGYMDLTGRFPYKLSCWNECIFISYNYDGNTILAQA